MLCRLCFEESSKCFTIYNGKEESEVAKMVVKYLHIEIMCDDNVSNQICPQCWNHLHTFHKFALLIEQKQVLLKQQLLFCNITCDDALAENPEVRLLPEVSIEQEHKPVEFTVAKVNIKNSSLCEPQIELFKEHSHTTEFETEFSAADADNILQQEDYKKSKAVTRSAKRKTASNIKRDIPKRTVQPTAERLLRRGAGRISKARDENSRKDKLEKTAAVISELDNYIGRHATLSCSLCSQQLEDFIALKKHFRQQHQCVGYMVCCGKRYLKRRLYVDHLKLHENPEHFKCTECHRVLASRSCYNNHMATMHPQSEELKFQCEICMRKFARQYILDYHLITHQKDINKHKCLECNKGFRTSNSLKAHYQRMHLNATVTICDICGKNFRSSQSLELHKSSVHRGVQLPKAQCQICQKWVNACNMYVHMYKHKDVESGKEFVCPQCGIVKSARHTLSSHIRYHHSNKSFICTVCGKSSKSSRALEEHMATHTGKDLYNCTFCTRTFKSSANMYSHRKKMHSNELERLNSDPTGAAAETIASTLIVESKS